MLYFPAKLNLSKISTFCIQINSYLVICSENWIENLMSFWTHQISPNFKFCLSPSKEKKELFVLKQISLKFLRTFFGFIPQSFLFHLLTRNKTYQHHFKFQFRFKNKKWYTSITNFLMKYLNSLFNKSCSLCVCRSSILFIFILNLVNLLGVSLDCWSKSQRIFFYIDLH